MGAQLSKLATIMNKQEAKKFILQNWKLSSGKRITEMLKRYLKTYYFTKDNLKELEIAVNSENKPSIIETAKEIFKDEISS